MITPTPLGDLLAADPIAAVKTAIVARLTTLLPGVRVVSHPGKVDFSDVVAKAVVAAPGIAVGWSRIRAPRIVDGAYTLTIEWAAYVVVEDTAIAGRRVEREAVGLAIGRRLVEIVEDADEQTWGLGNLLPPSADPAPELKPLFTVRDVTQGAAYYAVTWTQTIVDQGRSLFAGATPTVTSVETGVIDIGWPEGETMPPEVLAMLDQAEGA
jgi:hypothetical protein